jgi:hypothetical protein
VENNAVLVRRVFDSGLERALDRAARRGDLGDVAGLDLVEECRDVGDPYTRVGLEDL